MQLTKTDLFTFIHKALRSLIYNLSSKLQTADFSSELESKNIVSILRHDLGLLHEHADHEDNIIFPEVKNEEPEMIKVLENEHIEIGEKLNVLNNILDLLQNETESKIRLKLGNELNFLFNDFAASYLNHMNHEESTVLEASQKYLSDEELIAIRTRIQTKIPPERYRIWLDWMLRSANITELIGLLNAMKINAPKPVFDNIISTAEKIIEPSRWELIKEKIGS